MKSQKKGFSPELQSCQSLKGMAHRFMEYCENYTSFFNAHRRNVSNSAKNYLAGILMKSSRKNIERINEYVEGSNYESCQNFISDSTWDYKKLNAQIGKDVNKYLGGKESVLCLDESCFSKKGTKSAGVARQWNGRLGKIDNCQVGVFATLCNGKHSSIIDSRLYLPKDWTDDKERCAVAKIPEDEQVFKTKLELALEMIDNATSNDINFSWIAADAFYGRDFKLLKEIDNRKTNFVADIPSSHCVYLEDPKPYRPRRRNKIGPKIKRYKAKITHTCVDDYFNQLTKDDWSKVNVRRTTKGMLKINAHRKRVYLWNENEKEVRCWWLVILHDPKTNEKKWFLSNSKETVSLQTIVKKHACRYYIERTFQDGKTSVGMADYQVRGWIGWHHHMSMIKMALFFLVKERDINKNNLELLSCQDIVELLNLYLPRKDVTEEAVFNNMLNRHKKRKSSIESAYKKQKLQT